MKILSITCKQLLIANSRCHKLRCGADGDHVGHRCGGGFEGLFLRKGSGCSGAGDSAGAQEASPSLKGRETKQDNKVIFNRLPVKTRPAAVRPGRSTRAGSHTEADAAGYRPYGWARPSGLPRGKPRGYKWVITNYLSCSPDKSPVLL